MAYQLVIGNKNYSSWSMRPWVLMTHFGIPFEEVRIPLYTPAWQAQIRKVSPTGKVPCLICDATTVWDSLAIAETLHERHPALGLYPADPAARALARSVSAEMHSGFSTIRAQMSMNIRLAVVHSMASEVLRSEVDRVKEIFATCLARSGGPYLFGQFSIADAMYAPVIMRFRSYGVSLDALCEAYRDTIVRNPAVSRWISDALEETETIPDYETVSRMYL